MLNLDQLVILEEAKVKAKLQPRCENAINWHGQLIEDDWLSRNAFQKNWREICLSKEQSANKIRQENFCIKENHNPHSSQ